MIKVSLKDVKLFGFHGVYEKEKLVGNDFLLNLDVLYNEDGADIQSINETVNYVELYELVTELFNDPKPLLETLAQQIIHQTKLKFPHISQVEISIEKVGPRIVGFKGIVGVSVTKKFDK